MESEVTSQIAKFKKSVQEEPNHKLATFLGKKLRISYYKPRETKDNLKAWLRK
jgi:hypothetical protein